MYGTNGVVVGGISGYNSACTPFCFTDGNPRILRSDDLSGTNAIAYGNTRLGRRAILRPPGALPWGSTGAAVTVTLTNRQTTVLSLSSVGISGPFAISSNTCGTSLAAGASCAVGVTFTPAVTGAASGTLTFIDSASNSPQKVSLSGTGSTAVALSALP